MSRSPYFFVERYDINTEKYELQHPIVWNYNHTKQETADLYPYNGSHNLFSILEAEGISYDFPSFRGIHKGLPKDVCEDIKKAYNDCSYPINSIDKNAKIITPTARWFTYADMYIYCLEHPKVPDYEAMDEAYEEGKPTEKIMTDTPVLALKKRIDAFLEVMDGWDWEDDYSRIRIIYWIL